MVVLDVVVLIRRLRRRIVFAARVRMAGEEAAGLGLCNLCLGLVQSAEKETKKERVEK